MPHVRARYYDLQVGRFLSRDPVLSEHPYLYCEDDPVHAVDPSGYKIDDWDWFWGSVGGGIGGSIGSMLAPEAGGVWFGMGMGAVVGLAVGDAIWEGGEQVYDTVRDSWNWLAGKLSKLREYNAMLEELGL